MNQKNKKIGILTFHRALNYGAKLQAYALCTFLSSYYQTEIIDYRNDYMENVYFRKPKYTVKQKVKNIIKSMLFFWLHFENVKNHKLFLKSFDDFDKNINISEQLYTAKTISSSNEKYDAFICGSDQIRNLQWSSGDWNYFLEFANHNKRFSYAASFGGDIFLGDKTKLGYILNSFQNVLVREKTGKKIINQIDNKLHVAVVCDPVFLLSKNTWLNVIGEISLKKKYILLYIVSEQTNAVEFALNLAKKNNLDVLYLNLRNEFFVPNGCKNLGGVGPKEFLNYIYSAEYVVTTSFHALAFSIIFNKTVFYELNKNVNNNNSRIEDLVYLLGYKDHEIVDENSKNKKNEPVDWNDINEKINLYSEYSKELLLNSLKNI